eukprot:TRINITY_DN241_c0_g1_i4.p1 TRINITY_DN241_c0_g1~~TRINITY_DN241_c0_g1_i4.p1  ORF type:complete len:185 (+),score=18.23 TRINITY_DN241_c0_g1_i4:1034-1588(+)
MCLLNNICIKCDGTPTVKHQRTSQQTWSSRIEHPSIVKSLVSAPTSPSTIREQNVKTLVSAPTPPSSIRERLHHCEDLGVRTPPSSIRDIIAKTLVSVPTPPSSIREGPYNCEGLVVSSNTSINHLSVSQKNRMPTSPASNAVVRFFKQRLFSDELLRHHRELPAGLFLNKQLSTTRPRLVFAD